MLYKLHANTVFYLGCGYCHHFYLPQGFPWLQWKGNAILKHKEEAIIECLVHFLPSTKRCSWLIHFKVHPELCYCLSLSSGDCLSTCSAVTTGIGPIKVSKHSLKVLYWDFIMLYTSPAFGLCEIPHTSQSYCDISPETLCLSLKEHKGLVIKATSQESCACIKHLVYSTTKELNAAEYNS